MTTNDRRVLVHPDKKAMTGSVAARFLTKLVDILDEEETANVVLTGGTVGPSILAAVNDSAARDSVDWTRVHFWFGDERWLPQGDPERNDTTVRAALLDHIDVPAENIHAMGASDAGQSLEEAVEAYTAELAAHANGDTALPRFDITFLGVGPDGHVASLFPDSDGIRTMDAAVIPVRNSPKPPAERISLTLPVLNSSLRIWMVLAGPDKAFALGLALAGADRTEVPVAGIKGRKRTVFFIDREAAADVPENLMLSSY